MLRYLISHKLDTRAPVRYRQPLGCINIEKFTNSRSLLLQTTIDDGSQESSPIQTCTASSGESTFPVLLQVRLTVALVVYTSTSGITITPSPTAGE